MGTVIFGHGGLDPVAAKDMEWVAIPADTTLQFYAEAGQTLLTGQTTWAKYAAELTQPWPALDSTRVTYNLRLEALNAQEQKEIDVLGADFPHTIVMIGRDLPSAQLCTGDSTTCPSDPRMIAGTVAGPREHGCDGLLATYKGQELHWIACTGIDGFGADAQGAVDTARGDAPASVLHGENPDSAVATALGYLRDHPQAFEAWFDSLSDAEQQKLLADPGIAAWSKGRTFTTTEWAPSDADVQAVAAINQPYVKGLGSDDEGTWQVAGFLVLLGDGHGYVDWARGQHDYASGTFKVKRATFGAGKLVFSGVPPMHQGTLESAVGQFSDKEIEFA
jgi:hypothetical protein